MGAGVNVRAAHRLARRRRRGRQNDGALLAAGVRDNRGYSLPGVPAPGGSLLPTLLRTKSELITEAVTDLRTHSLGMPAMAVYNFGSGILSACGETKRPLIYLSIAGALNVALNLFFVICCGMAASGVAAASVISQYLSAGLIVVYLVRRRDCCQRSVPPGSTSAVRRAPTCSCWEFRRVYRTRFSPWRTCSYRPA